VIAEWIDRASPSPPQLTENKAPSKPQCYRCYGTFTQRILDRVHHFVRHGDDGGRFVAGDVRGPFREIGPDATTALPDFLPAPVVASSQPYETIGKSRLKSEPLGGATAWPGGSLMAAPSMNAGTAAAHKPWYQHLYAQVLCAILLGVLLGYFYPSIGEQMKPLGDAFIKLIKMLIAPIIFCTVVHGIASMEDMKKVGRVGIKALVYFEVMTTVALVIGLVIVNLWRPGVGMNIDPARSTRLRSPHTPPRQPSRARLSSSCTLSRQPSSVPSPRARSCRSCCSRSFLPSRCIGLAKRASRCSI
jgi:Sodium:dicarboxylate symporter family